MVSMDTLLPQPMCALAGTLPTMVVVCVQSMLDVKVRCRESPGPQPASEVDRNGVEPPAPRG
jgi:hypothetical protein